MESFDWKESGAGGKRKRRAAGRKGAACGRMGAVKRK